MAVYGGTQRRTTVAPHLGGRGGVAPHRGPLARPVDGLARRRTRTPSRAGRRTSRTGLVLAGIVVAFLLAMFSLSQTVRVSATGVDAAALSDEQTLLLDRSRSLKAQLSRAGQEPAVRRRALDAGLGPLVNPLIVPAR
ncbi:MAG: hypothetical protein H6Q36_497 [Chloroflexi bacterium]|jgi:hypothetical protein|nr:hypothetical protein [Chloroflexota bacterium]